jgi:CMP-N,N'-diacetyllegionaminic acid synthase
MYKKKKILAVILARGGSKGIKNKNIININNKPLIAYTILEAKKSKYIDKIVVSTDSSKIISIAKKYGAEAPFVRPKSLSGDKASSADCILHAMEFCENFFKDKFDYVIELMCTNPFKDATDIDRVIKLQIDNKVKIVIGVSQLEDHHPRRIKKINKKGFLEDFCLKEKSESRRQDLKPEAFIRNGSIYSLSRDMVLKKIRYKTKISLPYIMTKNKSINIDTRIDLKFAKFLFTNKKFFSK